MDPSLIILIAVTAAVLAAGGLISYSIAQRQEQKVRNSGMSGIASRHPVIFNPVFWAYLLFGVATIVAVAYYFGVYDPQA